MSESTDALAQLTDAQISTMLTLATEFKGGSVWHFNECGCCISLHAKGRAHEGYVIGEDGEYDWVVA